MSLSGAMKTEIFKRFRRKNINSSKQAFSLSPHFMHAFRFHEMIGTDLL